MSQTKTQNENGLVRFGAAQAKKLSLATTETYLTFITGQINAMSAMGDKELLITPNLKKGELEPVNETLAKTAGDSYQRKFGKYFTVKSGRCKAVCKFIHDGEGTGSFWNGKTDFFEKSSIVWDMDLTYFIAELEKYGYTAGTCGSGNGVISIKWP